MAAHGRRPPDDQPPASSHRGPAAAADAGRPAESPEPSPDAVTLQDALLRLPTDQRVVVLLHHVADLAVEDIARELEIPLGTVKSRLSRGRATLKALLGEEVTDHA